MSSTRAYAVALAAVGAALAARAFLMPILGLSMQYSFSLLATSFAVWYCGFWPAILVALLGGLGGAVLYFGPISTLGSFVAVVLYVLMCGAVIAAGHVNRRTLMALQTTRSVLLDARENLEDQVRARTAELARARQNWRAPTADCATCRDACCRSRTRSGDGSRATCTTAPGRCWPRSS